MAENIKTITIYGASSSKIASQYIEAARQLGQLAAKQNLTCINGGGDKGLMGAVTDGVLQNGGKVIGIIPRFMINEGWVHASLTEVIATEDMHTRKQLMAKKSDACIALPGGIGTLEELLEIITWKQLGLYVKPIVILNINGYYDDLLAMLQKAENENFMRPEHGNIWQVAYSPEEALNLIMNYQEWHINPLSIAAL